MFSAKEDNEEDNDNGDDDNLFFLGANFIFFERKFIA